MTKKPPFVELKSLHVLSSIVTSMEKASRKSRKPATNPSGGEYVVFGMLWARLHVSAIRLPRPFSLSCE